MLQERFYPEWARGARRWWNRKYNRIILFWCMALAATVIVIMVISTDWIKWDSINASFLATNELSRSFLASFILVMDLLIVMQASYAFVCLPCHFAYMDVCSLDYMLVLTSLNSYVQNAIYINFSFIRDLVSNPNKCLNYAIKSYLPIYYKLLPASP